MENENLKVGIAKYIPFTKARQVYKEQLKNELFRLKTAGMTNSQIEVFKTRQTEFKWINGTSWLFIAVITGLWGAYYNIPLFQDKISFLAMGMHQTDPSWIEHGALFVIPASSGAVLHNLPKLLPSQKLKIVGHLIIKIVPVILLLLSYVLIHYERVIRGIKKDAKTKTL